METLTQSNSQAQAVNKVFSAQQANAATIRKSTAQERVAKLKRLEKAILSNREKIENAIHSDFKKHPIETAVSEIYKELIEIRHTCKKLSGWMKPKKVSPPLSLLGTRSKVVYEPKGTTLIIAPWNYPFQLCINPLLSAIAAGNTAIVKPSELTPHTSKVVKEVIGEVFEENEVAVVEGGLETSTELLKLPFNHIFFTGSPRVGKLIMEAASKNLSSVTLELGGKSPLFIDKSADLKDAAEKIVWGKFLNNGQTCIAPDYALVDANVKDEFIKILGDQIEKAYNANGKGIEQTEEYCRIVNLQQFQRLSGLIEQAVETGATVAYGGKANPETNYISPTLLTKVDLDSKVMQEEIFGPILPIVSYENIDTALNIVNQKEKPLALYIFSKNKKYDKYILENTSAGGTCINDVVLHISHPELPFGGVNNSGIGKAHGFYGFTAFSNQRAVLRQRIGLTSAKLMYPPFNEKTKKLLNLMIKWL
ncbi:aldehyde dehydrogenase family protein [Flammeovirgaceae bacterium SG7u.111]|nr:aldehyde dehydrogenase family protein [Flammeovirgaceae bacterium SG7u.132]WPO37776.1 aldehyde dehydrogenase family protein [Flammeovirgaceae bacterium SG7u.111]